MVEKSESTIGRSDREGNSIIIRFRGNGAHISMAKALFPLSCRHWFFFSVSLCVLHYYICCRSSTPAILIDIHVGIVSSLCFSRCLCFFAVLCCFSPLLGWRSVYDNNNVHNIVISHVRAHCENYSRLSSSREIGTAVKFCATVAAKKGFAL